MLKIFTIHISCTKTNLIFTNVYREMLAMWRSSSSMAAVAPTGERERERDQRETKERQRETKGYLSAEWEEDQRRVATEILTW
jgi:hypothetical protein